MPLSYPKKFKNGPIKFNQTFMEIQSSPSLQIRNIINRNVELKIQQLEWKRWCRQRAGEDFFGGLSKNFDLNKEVLSNIWDKNRVSTLWVRHSRVFQNSRVIVYQIPSKQFLYVLDELPNKFREGLESWKRHKRIHSIWVRWPMEEVYLKNPIEGYNQIRDSKPMLNAPLDDEEYFSRRLQRGKSSRSRK